MPDANKEHTINQLVGAAFGAAGQRCMALSTAVFVGETKNWIPEIVERAKKLQVNEGMQSGADLGPLISPEAKQRVEQLIQSGVDEGAKVSVNLLHVCSFWCTGIHSFLFYSWCWMAVGSPSPVLRRAILWPQPFSLK